jgi:RNA polymerase sigma-70 factor (ECF subfamily)
LDDSRIAISPASAEPSVVERLEKKDIQQKVQRCIESLESDFREVVILRDIQGFSYEEIGDMLNIPVGTVKSRIFRARSILRECLKEVQGVL